jgi:hypothetical protein
MSTSASRLRDCIASNENAHAMYVEMLHVAERWGHEYEIERIVKQIDELRHDTHGLQWALDEATR